MKGKFLSRLHYDWIKYVAVTIVAVILWYFIFTLFNAPAPTETINVFFAGKVKDYSVKKIALGEMKTYGVRAIEITSCEPNDNAFKTKYSVVALNGSDVVIVPESVASETDCAATFTEIADENAYSQGGKGYGRYLTDEAKEALSAYFSFGYPNFSR